MHEAQLVWYRVSYCALQTQNETTTLRLLSSRVSDRNVSTQMSKEIPSYPT